MEPSPLYLPPRSPHEAGITLIAVIGVLAVISVGLSMVSPSFVRMWDRHHEETEVQHLRQIADGIFLYLEQTKTFPPSLASLSPDYLPFPSAQLTQNDRGYPRYYFVHPTMSSFDDAVGLSSSELPDARVLLISNLTRDESPTITNVAEFETWWATDESTTPGLHIHRSNVGFLFHLLTINQDGDGGSYQVNTTATDSGGGPLALHSNYHLTGTSIQFDEADFYVSPEVQFALTTNTVYWFDPLCTVNKQWNPLDPDCGSGSTLWLTTSGSTSDTPGITWTDSELVAFDEPNLTYESGPASATAGTFSQTFNIENFTATADLDAVHYVGTTITTGGISLAEGDLLLSTVRNETLASDNSLSVNDEDIFSFRPTTSGNYSSGTFSMIIDGGDVSLSDLQAITLVEQATDVGGNTLTAGSFLWADSSQDVYEFVPTSLGSSTSGTATLFIDGSDINISGGNFYGLDVIESGTTVGDVTLTSGQILATLGGDDSSVGDNSISTSRADIFILDLASTGSSTAGNATLFLDGSDISMTASGENTDGLTLAATGAVLPPPTCTAAGTNSGFEDSTALLGWSKTSGSGGVTDDTAGGDVTPTEGSKQAVMHNKANPASASAMASFLGFSTSALDSALTSAFGFSVSLGGGVAIKQSITVAAGDRITFDWDFLDDGADKDLGFAVFDGNIIALDSSPASGPSISDWNLESSDVDEVGSWESWTGKQHSTYSTTNYTFSSGGTFEIAFAVMNKNGDDDGLAGLVVDNVCNIGP